MKDNDYIKELFKNKLEHVEISVRPELWNNIASSIGTSASSTTSIFSVSKLIISSVTLASLGVLTYFIATKQPINQNSSHPTNIKINNTIKSTNYQQNNQLASSVVLSKKVKINKVITNQFDSTISSVIINSIDIDQVKDNIYLPILNETIQNQYSKLNTTIETVSSKPVTDAPLIEQFNKVEQNNLSLDVQFVFPNVFTPNNDGSNDKFELNTINLSDFSIVILNAKNETIYQSTTIDFSWDGRLQNGELVPAGRYIYYIVGQLPDGKPYTKINPLSIIY